jgi:hypothetical protein
MGYTQGKGRYSTVRSKGALECFSHTLKIRCGAGAESMSRRARKSCGHAPCWWLAAPASCWVVCWRIGPRSAPIQQRDRLNDVSVRSPLLNAQGGAWLGDSLGLHEPYGTKCPTKGTWANLLNNVIFCIFFLIFNVKCKFILCVFRFRKFIKCIAIIQHFAGLL